MQRYDRTRYLALGLPALFNAASLIYLQELYKSHWPNDLAGYSYWALACGLGLFGVSAMIKRARDMGSSAWGILLGFLFAPPFMLLIALVLAFVPSHPNADEPEPSPPPISRGIWLNGLALTTLPWLAVILFRTLSVSLSP